MAQTLTEIRNRIEERSGLSPERTQEILRVRYARIPHRVAFALERWPLDRCSVLDVGCSFATCLMHFGPGSLGIDNSPQAVAFCRSVGLEAQLIDVDDESLDAVPDGAFGFLWVSDILEHLESPRLLLRALRPKLEPAGRLLLHTSVLPRSRLARTAFRRLHRAPFDADVHYHQFTVETIRHLLERSGYRPTATAVPVPGRYAAASRYLPAGIAPRVVVEAVPDAAVEATVRRSERRNKHIE